MRGVLIVIGVLVGWILLQRYVLPRLGIRT
jgi:hypothetical protein